MWYKETQGKVSMSRVTNTYLMIFIGLLLGLIIGTGIGSSNQNDKLDALEQDMKDLKTLIKDGK